MAHRYAYRALVLQGGGVLGGYKAGVVKALHEKLSKEDEENGAADRPLFDIVAGASIGPVNAAILVSHVLNRLSEKPRPAMSECWRTAVETLDYFWRKEVPNYNLVLDNGWTRAGMAIWWNSMSAAGEMWNEFWTKSLEQYDKQLQFREKSPFIWWYFGWPDKYGPLASGEAARRYYTYLTATVLAGVPKVLSAWIYRRRAT